MGNKGHLHIGEDQLGCHGCAHTAFVFDLLSQCEAGHSFFHDERSEIRPSWEYLGAVMQTRLGIYQEYISRVGSIDGPIGDPHFRPIDSEIRSISTFFGSCAHAEHIYLHTYINTYTHTYMVYSVSRSKRSMGLSHSRTCTNRRFGHS